MDQEPDYSTDPELFISSWEKSSSCESPGDGWRLTGEVCTGFSCSLSLSHPLLSLLLKCAFSNSAFWGEIQRFLWWLLFDRLFSVPWIYFAPSLYPQGTQRYTFFRLFRTCLCKAPVIDSRLFPGVVQSGAQSSPGLCISRKIVLQLVLS